MVAVAIRLRLTYSCSTKGKPVAAQISLLTMTPTKVAAALVDEHSSDPEWLDAFADSLDRRRGGRDLDRILSIWGLSRSEAGRKFGVSRQAVAKWLTDGIPTERVEAIADLAASTDLLVRYLNRDRIAAVVRRPIPSESGRSLLDLLGDGRHRDLLRVCRDMFDFGAIHQ